MLNNKFDNLKRTVLYIPGYNVKLDDDNVQLIVSSYLKRDDHNVIFLDWVALTSGNYVTEVVPNALRVITLKTNKILQIIKAIIYSSAVL